MLLLVNDHLLIIIAFRHIHFNKCIVYNINIIPTINHF